MSIKIGPDSDVRPWNKAGQDERRRELSGLALYYFDMHHFYGDAVERLFMISELHKIEAVVAALLDPSPKDALDEINIEVKFDAAMRCLRTLT